MNMNSHQITGEYLSDDVKAHTLSFRDPKGMTSTVKLEGAAIGEVTKLHPAAGDRLSLTCRDDEKGAHQAITHIARPSGSAPRKG